MNISRLVICLACLLSTLKYLFASYIWSLRYKIDFFITVLVFAIKQYFMLKVLLFIVPILLIVAINSYLNQSLDASSFEPSNILKYVYLQLDSESNNVIVIHVIEIIVSFLIFVVITK